MFPAVLDALWQLPVLVFGAAFLVVLAATAAAVWRGRADGEAASMDEPYDPFP